jgi:hypothetical protein
MITQHVPFSEWAADPVPASRVVDKAPIHAEPFPVQVPRDFRQVRLPKAPRSTGRQPTFFEEVTLEAAFDFLDPWGDEKQQALYERYQQMRLYLY